MDAHDNMNIEILEDRRKDVDGRVSISKYAKGKLLGKGGFAKCYLATSMSGTKTTYAIKIVCKDTIIKPKARQKLQTEIKIHKSLRHDHVVRFEKFFEDPTNAYMLLELCSNNSMSELVRRRKRLTELEARFYLFELVDALKYLHSVCVIHRDLKLGNLFLDTSMHVKVGDFGLATRVTFPEERKKTICGTPNYIAPEILEGKSGHSYEVDIWSTGVVLYTLIVGKPPYESKDVKSTYKRILSNNYAFPDNIVISDFCKNLIQNMLQTNPDHRLSLDDIHSHNFFCHATSLMPRSLPESTLFEAPYHLTAEPLFSQNGKAASSSAKVGDENDPNAINILPSSSNQNERNMNPVKPESSTNKAFDAASQERLTSNAKAMFTDAAVTNEWKSEKSGSSAAASRRPLKLSDPTQSSGNNSENKASTLPIRPLLPAQLQPKKSTNGSLLRGTTASTATLSQPAKYVTGERTIGYGTALNQFEVYSDTRPQTAAGAAGAGTKDDSPIEAHAPVDRIPSRVVQNRAATLVSSSSAPAVHPSSKVAPASRTDRFSGQAALQGTSKSKTLTANYLEGQRRQLSGSSGSGRETEPLETPLVELGHVAQEQQQQQGQGQQQQGQQQQQQGQATYESSESSDRRHSAHSKQPSEAWGTVSDKNSIRSMASVTNLDSITTAVAVQPPMIFTESDGRMNEKATRNSELFSTAASANTANNNVAVEMDVQCDITPTKERYPMTSNGICRELGTLETMHDVLSKNLASGAADLGRGGVDACPGFDKPHLRRDELRGLVAKVWVMRYVDYTSKYGLGFLLNTRSAGVYFNDSTKIVQSADGLMFQYIDKKKKSGEQTSQEYLMTSYPPELQKKVTLLRHFRNYLLDPDQKKRGEGEVPLADKDFGQRIDCLPPHACSERGEVNPEGMGDLGGSGGSSDLPFIKKWVRTRHAILFRLSNQTVQVVFFDYSEVLLSSEARVVTYVDKNGLRTDHSLDDVLHSDRYDIAKRLKYTKDIMSRLISLPAK